MATIKVNNVEKELYAVQSVCVMKDGKEIVFDLCLLNVDQQECWWDYCGNSTKYWCCVLIADYFAYQKSLQEQGLSHQTHKQ
jgi:hypothetical protein